MSWDELLIDDLENIPAGYLVSWKFFNAFFKAFQERADYIEQAERAETYDALILTGPQIGSTELTGRLSIFHFNAVSCFNNTTWYKEQTWLDLKDYTNGLTSSTHPPVIGMGIIDIEVWDEAALRTLLTDEVYESIFVSYSFDTNFNPSYWSGLYKLLSIVMFYRRLTIKTAHDPNPTEPYLVSNGLDIFRGAEGTGSSVDAGTDPITFLDNLVSESKSNPDSSLDRGSVLLSNINLSTDSRNRARNFQGFIGNVTNDSAGVFSFIVTSPLFCVTPALMNIEILIDKQFGDIKSTSDLLTHEAASESSSTLSYSDIEVSTKTGVVPASHTNTATSTTSGSPDTFTNVYVPDQTTFSSFRAENPKFSISYSVDRNLVDISTIADIRDTYSFSDTLADDTEPPSAPTNFSNESHKRRTQGTYDKINLAICELPQDEFKFIEQEEI
jgi:hypothetical protein